MEILLLRNSARNGSIRLRCARGPAASTDPGKNGGKRTRDYVHSVEKYPHVKQ